MISMVRYWYIWVVALFWGCAQQSSPTGGDKDVDPPVVVMYEPNNFQLQFDENEFTIVFDEYIQVNDLASQLIISPPLTNSPDYTLRGKSITIEWEDTLQANSTYQFNFGKSVVDLNEGNITNGLRYVFSTGSYIDSLFVYGTLVDASDNSMVPEAVVMLYKTDADTMPMTSPPDYFAVTDESGRFSIDYLPAGNFKLFALKEENNNFIYDGPPEKIAYLGETVESTFNDTTAGLWLSAFIERDTSQYISSSFGKDYGKYTIVFNIPTKNPNVVFRDPSNEESLESIGYLNATRDTLISWVTLPPYRDFDEVEVIVSDDKLEPDTSAWYIETDPDFREKAALKLSSNTNRNKLNLTHVFTLRANNPLVEADTSLIHFFEDSVEVFPSEFERGELNRKFLVHYPFKAESNYVFQAEAGAFKDVFESYSDSIKIAFSLQDADFYGRLELALTISEQHQSFSENRILQLLTQDNRVVTEVQFIENELTQSFEQLSPGMYKLKVIYDTNNDGKWTAGEYLQGTQPERLSFYPEEIQIRSNWDMELEWEPTTPY